MTKFAAYDDNSIYALGDTPEQAIQTARDDAKEPEAQFKTAPIREELAAKIDRDGWNGYTNSFEIDRATGYIIDTTNR